MSASHQEAARRRPNLLLLTVDDMDARSPGLGGAGSVTPNIDALAARSTRFTRAHVVVGVCQPSRSAIITGLLPHHNGAEGFEPIDDGVGLLTDLLHDAGYAVGILGKVDHLAPRERFGWDLVRTVDELGLGRDARRYGDATADLVALAGERPWFLMANAHDPHRPFHGSEQERAKWSAEERARIPAPSRTFEPEDAALPGFLPDLPEVRSELAQYLGSVRRCDDVVGAVLAAVRAAGQERDTMVVFLSDNGMAFPFAKANCYLRSTLTPLLVHWPDADAPAAEDDDLVSSLDLFPTVCESLGLGTPEGLDGVSLGTARQRRRTGRDALVTVFHETSAGRRYEMRCLQDAHFGYVWNAWAGEQEYRAENMEGLSWAAMVESAAVSPELAERTRFYLTRAREELYDLRQDPDCLHDLTRSAEHRGVLTGFRDRLAAWMGEHDDPQLDTFRRQVPGQPGGTADPGDARP